MASKQRKLSKCELSVYETLCYFAVFNYPIGLYKLSTFLISQEPFSLNQIQQALTALKHRNLITDYKGLYLLRGVKRVDTVSRSMNARHAIKQVEDILPILAKIPWILLICITGSCAASNKDEYGDIDIFIITKENRLWISRFFLVCLLKILKLYRTDKSPTNKICPNLLISEDAISWNHDKNVFVAHEIVAMHPIYDKNNTYFRFLAQNEWVRSYFPHFTYTYEEGLISSQQSKLMGYIEVFFMKVQIFYMRRHLRKEKVSKSIIHFDKADSKSFVLEKLKKIKAKTP